MAILDPFLVIFLHGVGGSGADMATLGEVWQKDMPQLRISAPDGIMTGPQGFGRAWFSIAGITDRNRASRIELARPQFDHLIQDIIDQAGFTGRLDRVALVGFSQGSIMALDAVISGRWPFAGVIAYSGRLVPRLPLNVSKTRIRLIHGEADTVIPAIESRKADDILRASGFDVTTTILPGVEHFIPAAGVRLGKEFISAIAG